MEDKTMYRKKKVHVVLAVIMVLTMMTMLLAACADTEPAQEGTAGQEGTQQATPTPATTTEGSGDETADENEHVTLQVLLMVAGAYPVDGADTPDVMVEVNRLLNELVPNTEMELTLWSNTEYRQKWDLAMAAGESYDVAYTGFIKPFVDEVLKGSFMELDDLWERYGQDAAREIPEWFLALGQFQGRQYVIPSYKDEVGLRTGAFLPLESYENFWDIDGAESVFFENLPARRSLTEPMYDFIEEYLERLSDAGDLRSGFSPMMFPLMNNGIIPLGSAGAGGNFPVTISLPNRGNQWDFTVRNWIETPEMVLFYEKMADWMQKGYIRSELIASENPRDQENLNSENGNAMWFHTFMNFDDQTARVRDLGTQFTYPGVQVLLEPDFYLTNNTGNGHCIPITARNPERAMQLINLLHSSGGREIYNLLAFGIEDRNYVVLDDGRIEVLNTDNIQHGMANWMVGNLLNSLDAVNMGVAGLATNFVELNNSAIVSPLIGFKVDTTPIMNEISHIRPIVNQYGVALMTGGAGSEWRNVYDEYLAALQDARIDDVIAEVQRQLDEFLAANGITTLIAN